MAKRPTKPQAPKARRLGRKPVPDNESRRDRFMRIGTKRVNAAIRQIQLLGNLCGPNYECDANDLSLMRDAIANELDMALARFSPRKRQGAEAAFSFKQTKSPSLASH